MTKFSLLLLTLLFIFPLGQVVNAQETRDRPTPQEIRERRTSGEARENRRREEQEEEELEENPLEMTEPDPLLPEDIENRALSAAEARQLRENVNQLANEAADVYNQGEGDIENAFDIWYRELRLRRFLGRLEEVEALARVGEIAWRDEQAQPLTVIRNRLEQIQYKAQDNDTLNQDLYWALGSAYQRIRFYPNAVEMYNLILADVREMGDINELESTLQVLGDLHLGWFNYPKAEEVYQELLEIARQSYDDAGVMEYLEDLAYIYDQMIEPESAIAIRKKLLESYLKKELVTQIAPVTINLARNYLTMGEVETANLTYQEAFSLAWANQQFGYVSDSLSELAALYNEFNQPEYALDIYQEQLKAAQYAYDFYTMMETYKKMGDLYMELEQYEKALQAFREGLNLAQKIDHRPYEFEDKIYQINQFLQPIFEEEGSSQEGVSFPDNIPSPEELPSPEDIPLPNVELAELVVN